MFLFEPFLLVLCQQKVLSQDLLLPIECAHNDSHKEIEDQKVAKDYEKHEENGPVNVLVLYRLLVNPN